MTKPVSKKCPCGGGKYAKCCEPFHAGTKHARSPEELMRSRYSAYARGCEQYLRGMPAVCRVILTYPMIIQHGCNCRF